VLSGVALLWFGLACYLLMLGLIGEVALRQAQAEGFGQLPVVHEGTI
jgi:hypothetical protein